ncbi:MAG: amino acid adenylation domain-containing protein [Methylococcaceae bacterium]
MHTETNNIAQKINLSAAKRAILEKQLQGKLTRLPVSSLPFIKRSADEAPLSFAQQRLWFFNQLEPESAFYNLCSVLRITGPLDVLVLEKSINHVIRRHEILRTCFTKVDGKPFQLISQDFSLKIAKIDLTDLYETEQHEMLDRVILEEVKAPFDLTKLPLLRVSLLCLNEQEYVLLLTMHHIISDGWSQGIFIHECSAFYKALTTGVSIQLPELPIQYADFAHWQRNSINEDSIKKQLAYWKQQLQGAPSVLELPSDRPRPAVQSYRGAGYFFTLEEHQVSRLNELGREYEATPFMILLAVFSVLLSRYSGQIDLCIGTPIANRNRIEVEKLIGFFVNTLVLRIDLSKKPTFTELLKRVREQTLSAQTHQDLAFEILVDELQPKRDLSRNPLFQVMFAFQNATSEELALPGLQISKMQVETQTALFDLSLDAANLDGGLGFSFEYNIDLFDKKTIIRMGEHFQMLVTSIIANPEQPIAELPLLSAQEYQSIVVDWNVTEADYPKDKLFHQLFEEQVRENPERIAAMFRDQQISYRELNRRANSIAHALLKQGVGSDTTVAVVDERGIDLLCAMLGILKAGGVYLPLDPRHPPTRVAQIVSQSNVPFVITGDELIGTLKQSILSLTDNHRSKLIPLSSVLSGYGPDHDPPSQAYPKNLAYIIYTSGSTGIPKGVMVDHQGMLNNAWSKIHWLDLTGDDVIAQTASQCFDISVWQFLTALLCGATVQIFPDEIACDAVQLLCAVDRCKVTIMETVPSMISSMLEAYSVPVLTHLRWLLPTGEELPPELCRKWLRAYPNVALLNAYGPAECSDDVALYPILREPEENVVHMPVGRPNDNISLYILNPFLQPQPIGVTGELYIGGVGVGRGYLNDPARTAEVFVPDPFSVRPGDRLYKTGDLAKFLNDGNVEFLGRIDHQVKIRGFRIELGEIEARLLKHPQIREAVVLAREDRPEQRLLVAYIVAVQPDALPDQNCLRKFLKSALPEYMVPTVFVSLEKLPLSSNGKVDRKALPVPDFTDQINREYVAPRNFKEETLASIWTEVLGLERVGIHDNFFEVGGESVVAIQVVSRVNRAGYDVTPRQIFQHQTIAELAEALKSQPQVSVRQAQANDGICLVSGEIERFSLAELDQSMLGRLLSEQPDIEDIYPLTSMQEGMLFHTLLNPGSGVYVMQDRFLIKGDLDASAFAQAWRIVVSEHVILRTSFIWDTKTKPHQVVHRHLELPMDIYDWRELNQLEQEKQLEELLSNELKQGFDLAKLPLFRIRLISMQDQTYLFEFSHHHILLDDWSASLLLADFYSHYEEIVQQKAVSYRSHRSYRDYIAWLKVQDPLAAEDFWRNELRGFSAPTALMVDHPPVELTENESEVADIVVELSAPDSNALCVLAQKHQITPNTFIQGSWALLLSRYSNQREVLFGVTVVGRPPNLEGMESMVGLFINGLPLRLVIDPDVQVLSWLREIFIKNLQMREYEYSPLVQIQEWSELPRGQQLFSSLITYENAPVDAIFKQGNLKFQVIDSYARVHTNYPLTLVILPGSEFSLRLSYDCRYFDADVIARMLNHFKTLLEGMIHYPESRLNELEWLTAKERRNILTVWNRTEHNYPEPQDIIARLERQAVETPAAIAAACGESQLTYRELNLRVNRLAHALVERGIGPDVMVALLDDRGIDFLIMILSIFKAGGAYLPLEPIHPNARLVQVIQESRVGFVLAGTAYQTRLRTVIESCSHLPVLLDPVRVSALPDSSQNPQPRHGKKNLAFTIFTSGSTGTPKGAMVEFQGMYNNLITKVPVLGLTSADVIAQTASQCFDISVWQFLTALTCGARVEIFPDAVTHDPHLLLNQLVEKNISVLEAVPSMIRALLDMSNEDTALPCLRWLIPCGEVFPPELCRRWMARFPHVRLLNAYGPAECSDDVTYHFIDFPIRNESIVPIGRPVDNTRIYILSRWLEPVPVSVPGEICVAGIQVGRGYLNRPDLTAEAFIPNPFGKTGERLYRTGDLGRYRSDGVIEFLGRNDYQVKIRGFRIELGEIEARLSEHPQIKAVAVIARQNPRGDKELVAYVESLADEFPDRGTLRVFLSDTLPDYMVPTIFVFLKRLPTTSNGKVDRKNLPAPDFVEQVAQHYVAPRNPTEEQLAVLWCDVLGISQVGVDDNFFELGGHSLLAVKLLSKLRDSFKTDLALRSLFDRPTIATQADLLTSDCPEAHEEINFETEAVLESGIQPDTLAAQFNSDCAKVIFLTGATGFLGAFLIHELANQTSARIYCLVRAQSDLEAWDRLQNNLNRYGLWHTSLTNRLCPIRGDLSKPFFGLSEERFLELSECVDVIYHCGAAVNDVASYQFLKPINVLGTQEVLRLACRHKTKFLHYVSTTSVFGNGMNLRPTGFSEDDFPEVGADLQDGYDQSKWVAESLVRIAGARGLPVSIYRPAFVVGHSENGTWNNEDTICRLIKGCIEVQSAPQEDIKFNMVPVDYVSKAIVFLSRQASSVGSVFHITNPYLVSTVEVVGWINDFGYEVKTVPMKQWRQEIVKAAKDSTDFPLYPLLPIFENDTHADEGNAEDMQTFDCRNTVEALRDGAIICPTMTKKQMQLYFKYFKDIGFL